MHSNTMSRSMPTTSPVDAFREAFGAGTAYRAYTTPDDQRLRHRIPPVMRTLLQRDGWCSYLDQVLWLCDPDVWDVPARAWLPGVASPEVVARSATGDLFVWDGDLFHHVMPHEAVIATVDDADGFFARTLVARDLPLRTTVPE